MRIRNIVLTLFLSLTISLLAQEHDPLEHYIRMGLESNLSLKQKEASFDKSFWVLKEAKSYFYPQISLIARYSVAEGGRMINFPAGDLLNPVYSTLNALTGSSAFPEIENIDFQFFRPREHETKIQVIHPLLNTDIYFNEKIKLGLVMAEKADLESYQRLLVYEITVSYYNIIKTRELLGLYMDIRTLADENLKVNERLFSNDMVTRSSIERSHAELARIDQQIASAEKDYKISIAYFNFLLNRPIEEEVIVAFYSDFEFDGDRYRPELAAEEALIRREDLKKLDILEGISAIHVRMLEMKRLPEMIFALDYGFQGSKYRFTAADDFVLASFVLRWNLFHGLQNRHKTEQARLNEIIVRSKHEETSDLIRLEITKAWYSMEAARKGLEAAEREFKASQAAFREISKQYRNGLISMIEYLEARTSMTAAGTNHILAQFEYKSQIAAFERSACLFPIQEFINNRSL